jgi:hypothetical protein
MAFSLSQAAANEIRARLNRSSENSPVASLQDQAPAPDSLAKAIDRANPNERVALAQAEYARLEPALRFGVAVALYASSDCRPQDLVEVSGVPFVMPKEMLALFASCSLEYANGTFLLRRGDRDFASLSECASALSNAT